jgi:hypothetical protein
MSVPGLATAARTLAAVALMVLCGAALVRTIAAAFDPFLPYPGHPADYGIARGRAIRAALPRIAHAPQDAVLVLGSSGVGRAFVPAAFDKALGDSGGHFLSYNLAQPLLQPETALAMAKTIRQSYEEVHRRVAITIFGISVPELKRGAVGAARRRMPDQAFVFASAEVLYDRAREDLYGALGDGLQLALFGNVRPAQVGRWLVDWVSAAPPPCESGMIQPPADKAAQEELVAFCRELRVQFPRGLPAWNLETRGAYDFGLPATRPMLERLATLQTLLAVASGDPLRSQASLPSPQPDVARSPAPKDPNDIDEDAVRTLAAAVQELKAVSRRMFVLRDILNPALLVPVSTAELAHWRDVAGRIARANDVPLLDFNDGTFVASDFGDRTHLHPLAAERFSSLLATRMRPILQDDRAIR